MFEDIERHSRTFTKFPERSKMLMNIHGCSWIFTNVDECSFTFTNIYVCSRTFTNIRSFLYWNKTIVSKAASVHNKAGYTSIQSRTVGQNCRSSSAKTAQFNKAGYTATSCGWVGRGGNARFPTFQLERDRQTDRPTNQQTDKACVRN